MIETLEEFKNRVYGFEYKSLYPDEHGCFATGSSLKYKVDSEGSMRPYVGNTTVFILNDKKEENRLLRKRIVWMQDMLYDRCHDMLAERLMNDTFHMTLHDLKNGLPGHVSENEIRSIAKAVKERLDLFKKEPWKIRLQTTCVFNMVNTSVVLGLEPCTDEDCSQLLGLYEQMERIYHLGYPLTPHITLAYYKPGVYREDETGKLRDVFHVLSREKMTVEFCAEELFYQEFYDMNHYISV